MFALAMVVLPIASALPSGSQAITIQSPSSIDISFVLRMERDEAVAYRQAIDDSNATGNGDGIVTEEEAGAFQSTMSRAFSQLIAMMPVEEGGISVDTKWPKQAAFERIGLEGVLGATTGEEPVTSRLVFRFEFPIEANGRHRVNISGDGLLGGAFSFVRAENLSLRVPPGYSFGSAAGLSPELRVWENGANLTIEGWGGSDWVGIELVRKEESSIGRTSALSPAASVMGLAVAGRAFWQTYNGPKPIERRNAAGKVARRQRVGCDGA